MYPSGAVTTVEVGRLSERLDGAHRPGHFRGVATVVTKLLHMVKPDKAYFGQKDAAQVAVLRQMVRDLNFDVELVTGDTARDPDGLALSSRNVYLSAAQRRQALALPRALEAMQEAIADGQRERAAVLRAGTSVLKREPGVKVEYLEAVDWTTLEAVDTVQPGTLVAVAAQVGKTRLIDNFVAG
jgi:pantoate--beta-alanine ligase